MEYAALFVWLCLCLLLGSSMLYVLAGALERRPLHLLAAPGIFIRKFSMCLVALACGARVTGANVYDLSSRDVDYQADGVSSIAKVLAPLAPLFGCAVAAAALNRMFGSPLHLEYSHPELSSLDTGGLGTFVVGTSRLLADVVRRGAEVDWGNPRLYVLFALLFSLALGAAAQMERAREAVLGAALTAIGLAVLGSLSPGGPAGAWLEGLRDFVVEYSAVAFVMMVYGMLGAVIVGLAMRAYELITKSGGNKGGRTARLRSGKNNNRAA